MWVSGNVSSLRQAQLQDVVNAKRAGTGGGCAAVKQPLTDFRRDLPPLLLCSGRSARGFICGFLFPSGNFHMHGRYVYNHGSPLPV